LHPSCCVKTDLSDAATRRPADQEIAELFSGRRGEVFDAHHEGQPNADTAPGFSATGRGSCGSTRAKHPMASRWTWSRSWRSTKAASSAATGSTGDGSACRSSNAASTGVTDETGRTARTGTIGKRGSRDCIACRTRPSLRRPARRGTRRETEAIYPTDSASPGVMTSTSTMSSPCASSVRRIIGGW
jgi:hypothetical protein